MRNDKRKTNQLRPITLKRNVVDYAEGSCTVRFGKTWVHCTASVDRQLPRWRNESDGGWVTGEYDMLPRANRDRGNRNGGRSGRSQEISRLIGRSLRAITDLKELGPLMITIDCDVIQADGGTRTAAITGGFVALVDALRWCHKKKLIQQLPLTDSVAAISVGIVDDKPLLDLNYKEDFAATVDANFVITGQGQLVEVQATGEEATFSADEFEALLKLAQKGVKQLVRLQREALGPISLLRSET